jgi:Major Facilitator Superfamily
MHPLRSHRLAGTSIANGVSPAIITYISWPAVFYTFGASALLWLPFWVPVSIPMRASENADPEMYLALDATEDGAPDEGPVRMAQEASSGAGEDPLLEQHQSQVPPPDLHSDRILATLGLDAGFLGIMQHKEVWAICIAQYCQSWGTYFLLAWLPTYFLEQVCSCCHHALNCASHLPFWAAAHQQDAVITPQIPAWPRLQYLTRVLVPVRSQARRSGTLHNSTCSCSSSRWGVQWSSCRPPHRARCSRQDCAQAAAGAQQTKFFELTVHTPCLYAHRMRRACTFCTMRHAACFM